MTSLHNRALKEGRSIILLNSPESLQSIIESIPKRYRQAKMITFDGLDPTKSFFLSGNAGIGKTHLAYAYMRAHLNTAFNRKSAIDYFYRPIVVVNVADFMRSVRDKSFQQRAELVEHLQECQRLILDDLGAEYKTDYSDSIIYSIVEARYSNELYTGFTSNYQIKDLPYNEGEAARIVSRIRGIVGTNGKHVDGIDHRLQQGVEHE